MQVDLLGGSSLEEVTAESVLVLINWSRCSAVARGRMGHEVKEYV
jgi:hypothetical protein